MPTATARYGRPKGSGLDDSRQLESIAALLAANPKLTPTAAIRSLGVDDPSIIRRLRDKYRIEQMKIAAGVNGLASKAPLVAKAAAPLKSMRASLTSVPVVGQSRSVAPEPVLALTWLDLGLKVVAKAVDQQAAVAQYWLRSPAVTMALRSQLAMSAYVVAICAKGKSRRPQLH